MNADPADRTVHGRMADGSEIVRYDRSGKWYIEPLPGTARKRRQVDVTSAARSAARSAALGAATLGLPGGHTFDRRVRDLRRQAGQ